MCEFLVKAKEHWMDGVPEAERLKWDKRMQDKFARRTVPGDPICVRPDGWRWGKREDPARMAVEYPGEEIEYVIVKVPGMSVEEGQKYTEKDMVEVPSPDPEITNSQTVMVVRRKRKHSFSVSDVNAAKLSLQPVQLADKRAFEQKVEDKTSSVIVGPNG